jgi:hypothetical protein
MNNLNKSQPSVLQGDRVLSSNINSNLNNFFLPLALPVPGPHVVNHKNIATDSFTHACEERLKLRVTPDKNICQSLTVHGHSIVGR